MGETVLIAAKLKLNSNPFDASDGGGRLGRPLQKAVGEVIRHIGLETRVVIVSGNTGTGKTLLAKTVERISTEMGLSTRRFDRGDAVAISDGQRSDVLLVDEADTIPDSTLRMLVPPGDKRPATTTVLLCLPASTRRFSAAGDAVVVELGRLSRSDTRHYLQERATHAGFPNLFAPAAFDLLVDEARGVPRTLCSIASLAYFYAASAGATQISRDHVARALASQIPHPEMPAVPISPAPSLEPVSETALQNLKASQAESPQPNSATIAAFKRRAIAEPPKHETRAAKPQAASLPGVSPAVTPEELLKIIAAASAPSATALDELSIDHHNAESPKGAHAERIGFAPGSAGQESGSTRMSSLVTVGSAPLGIAAALPDTERVPTRPLLIVGSAVGVAVALAGAIALATFVPAGPPNERAAAATPTRNMATTAVVPAASPPVVHLAKAPDAPQHAGGKSYEADKTTGQSNPGTPVATPASIPRKTAMPKAPQRPRRTRPAPVPALAAASPLRSTRAAALPPPQSKSVTTAPVQVIAARDIGGRTNSADVYTIGTGAKAAAERSAPYPQVFGLRLRGTPESKCLIIGRVLCIDQSNSSRSESERPANSLAAKEVRGRTVRTYDFKPRYRLYQ